MDIDARHGLKYYVYKYWMSGLCFLTILILCMMPGRKFPEVNYVFFIPLDKVVHFTMFFGYALLLTSDFRKTNKSLKPYSYWAVLISSGYGMVIEVLQGTLTTTRSADINDWIADTIGAIAAALIYAQLLKLQRMVKIRILS